MHSVVYKRGGFSFINNCLLFPTVRLLNKQHPYFRVTSCLVEDKNIGGSESPDLWLQRECLLEFGFLGFYTVVKTVFNTKDLCFCALP